MYHIFSRLPAFSSEREHRLCAKAPEGLDGAHATLTAQERMKKNPELARFMTLYDDPLLRAEYKELDNKHRFDRAAFMSMLLDSALQTNEPLESVKRADIDALDPLGLVSLDNEALGQWLIDNVSKDVRKQIDADTENGLRLAELFRDAVSRATKQWTAGEKISEQDRFLLRIPLDHYRKVRTQTDAALAPHGVLVPGLESDGLKDFGDNNLDRREYFVLLNLVSRGEITKDILERVAKEKGVNGVRLLARAADVVSGQIAALQEFADAGDSQSIEFTLANSVVQESLNPDHIPQEFTDLLLMPVQIALAKRTPPLSITYNGDRWEVANRDATLVVPKDTSLRGSLSRSRQLYGNLSFQELGPQETLKSMGFRIGPDTQRAYIRLRRGQDPDFGVATEQEAGEDAIPAFTLQPGETAAAWERTPARALEFFDKFLVGENDATVRFKSSLKYHFGMTDNEKKDFDDLVKEGKATKPMDKENTLAALRVSIQVLMEADEVITQGKAQYQQLRERMNIGESIEDQVKNVWEYMKDIQSHPLGSSLAWVAAYVAIKKTWSFINSEHKNFTNLLFFGGVGGLALGLYQKHRTGDAWWEGLSKNMQGFFGREKKLSPQEQTLPNYWHDELKLGGAQEQICLSVLQDQPAGTLLDWYGRVEQQMIAPQNGKREKIEKAPFRIDPKLLDNFPKSGGGSVDREKVSIAFYQVLRKFFENRGSAARKEMPEFAQSTGIADDAGLGYMYIRERYLEKKYFTRVTEGVIRYGAITVEGKTIRNWDPEDPDLKRIEESNPTLYAELQKVHHGYFQETRERRTADWEMSYIFMQEANPEILRRQGTGGAEAAGYLDVFANKSKEFLQSVNVFAEPPKDKAEGVDLYNKGNDAEKNILGQLSNQRMLEPEKHLSSTADIAQEWDAFIERFPADADAREKLKNYMSAYLDTHDPVTLETMNLIEQKKQQLLILANKSSNRLNAEALNSLDPQNDVTWNSTMNTILNYVSPDSWTYPRITSFADLGSLFGSEVSERGGVDRWHVLARMFPAWQTAGFETTLHPRVKAYQNAFARLRKDLPSALSNNQVSALESQLSLRMANRALEGMLITHRKDGDSTPDLLQDRTVSLTEQKNLATYFDAMFTEVMGKRPEDVNAHVTLPDAIDNANNLVGSAANIVLDPLKPITDSIAALPKEIRALFNGVPSDKLESFLEQYNMIAGYSFNRKNAGLRVRAIDDGTKVRIIMPIWDPKIGNAPYPANATLISDKYPIEKTLEEFLDAQSEDLIKEWRDNAFKRKSLEMSNVIGSFGKLHFRLQGEVVELSTEDTFSSNEHIARISVYAFSSNDSDSIKNAYTLWRNQGVQKCLSDPDLPGM